MIIAAGRPAGLLTGHRGLVPGRPTLLLIHGSGGTREVWRCQVGPLDRHINVAAMDLPGHGKTPGPARASIPEYADWLIQAAEALKLPEPPILAGASLGGAIALEAAMIRPDAFGGLVIMASGAHLPKNPEFLRLLDQDYPAALDWFTPRLYAPDADPALIRQTRDIMANLPPDLFRADIHVSDSFDRRDRVKDIRLPALILCGRDDAITPLSQSEYLAQAMPFARLAVVEGAGHMAVIEKHKEVNRLILEFVWGLNL